MADSPITGKGFTVAQLFSDRRYGLDAYQREYSWSREDVRILLNDLHRRFSACYSPWDDRRKTSFYDPYFLGPFVYHEDGGMTYLVDGQQRITTLHLLLIHLRRLLQDAGEVIDASRLLSLICPADYGEVGFTIDIPERRPLLDALIKNRAYTLPSNASTSLRTLWERSRDLEEDFPAELRGDALPYFHDWLLKRVCLVGIRALNRDNGSEIYESMNDRGVRLSPVDLLKNFLFAKAGDDQFVLNDSWREMMNDLTAIDRDAPSDFLKAALLARHADLSEGSRDAARIDSAFHVWVRDAADRLGLMGLSQIREFIDELNRLAGFYATLCRASRNLYQGLEPVFYNARNSLVHQYPLVLAAADPDDSVTTFKEKAKLVAGFLDLLFVRRFVNNKPVQDNDFVADVHRLIPMLRKCRTLNDIAVALGEEVVSLDDDFSALGTFGLRADNRRQVRYLLARLTAHVEECCGDRNPIETYLNERQPAEIEHIWANRFQRYQGEVKTYTEFELWRNRLGALLLLSKSDNASYRDDPYEEKIEFYYRQNRLAASLNKRAHKKNPRFTKWLKTTDLTSFFHPWDRFNIDAIKTRQILYQRLAERIWSPTKLGFVLPADPTVSAKEQTVARRRTRANYGVEVLDLIEVGLIKPGARLFGKRRQEKYEAVVDRDGRIRIPSGEVFSSLSAAGQFVLRTKACPGWDFWCVDTASGRLPLKEIRNDGLERGLFETAERNSQS